MEKLRFGLDSKNRMVAAPTAVVSDVPTKQDSINRVSVRTLLQNRDSIILELENQDYVLRITRNNKLILTK